MTKPEHPLSWHAIARVSATIIGFYIIWRLFDTLILILVSMMLAAAFYPIVQRLNKRMPLPLASILVVFTLFVPIIIIGVNFLPGLVQQFPQIATKLNTAINTSQLLPPDLRNLDLTQYAQNAADYALRSTGAITGFITTFFTVIFLTLYFLIDSKRLQKIFLDLIPDHQENRINNLIEDLTRINGQYIRGNLLISVICGITIYIGLFLFNVPYAGSLALFAAITDLLPLIGAFIGAVPAIIIAFSVSPITGLLVLLLFIVYQQIENNIVSPNIYNRALDISPALSFIAVIVGTALFGIVGAFIALPIAASIPTIVKYWKNNN